MGPEEASRGARPLALGFRRLRAKAARAPRRDARVAFDEPVNQQAVVELGLLGRRALHLLSNMTRFASAAALGSREICR